MNKIKNTNKFSELLIEDINSLSEDEIDQELLELGFQPDKDSIHLKESIEKLSLSFRKERFRAIKSNLDQKGCEESGSKKSKDFLDHALRSGKSAKDFLIDMIVSGQAPQELTIAFRDGKDITEQEAKGIVRDLQELGYIKDDSSEQGN